MMKFGGTRKYWSPKIEKNYKLNAFSAINLYKSDVFSLGITILEMSGIKVEVIEN